jgi:ABC-type multidrug transport system fused ATPase/permease subunit
MPDGVSPEEGDVVEIGSHEELLAAGGLYRDLFTLQAERYGLAT